MRKIKGQAKIEQPRVAARRLKGQAAMEYLFTYGWALLILVAVIIAILATGVFNPSYFVSEECSIQPDIACTGFQLYKNGGTNLNIRIENRLGYRIYLDEVEFLKNDEVIATENVGAEIEQGGNEELHVGFGSDYDPNVGSIERMKLRLTYYTCAREVNPDCDQNADFEHVVTGRLSAQVEQG